MERPRLAAKKIEETLTGLKNLQSYLNWFTTDKAEMVWYDMSVEGENNKGEHRPYEAGSSGFAESV